MVKSGSRDFDSVNDIANALSYQLSSEKYSDVLKHADLLTKLNMNHETFHLSVAYMIVSSNESLNKDDFIKMLEIFSRQRIRQADLIKKFESTYDSLKDSLSTEELSRVIFAGASLSIFSSEHIIEAAERILNSPESSGAALGLAAESICLLEQDSQQLDLLKKLLSKAVPYLIDINMAAIGEDASCQGFAETTQFSRQAFSWSVVRYVLKHCHRAEYDLLSDAAKLALKKASKANTEIANRSESIQGAKKRTAFSIKLGEILDDLRIAYHPNVRRGPFKFDLVERDQRLVWMCADNSKYFAATFDFTPYARLQNRVIKAMGYKLATTAWWQWSRMRAQRTRIEFVRMSRYYALKDRREFGGAEGFDGWRLPHLQKKSSRSIGIHVPGYFTGFESHAESPY